MPVSPDIVITKRVGDSELRFKPLGSRFSLDLGGYQILTASPRGGNPQKIGESHPCSPNFDRDTANLGLPNHGVARNVPVTDILIDEPDFIRTRLLIAGGNYPPGVAIQQDYRLTEKYLQITTSHMNSGEVPAPVNYGDHLYFNAPQGNQDALLGSGRDAINLLRPMREDAVLPFKNERLLQIPGLPRLLLVGLGRQVINPWVDIDNNGKFDENYFCASVIEKNFRPQILGGNLERGFFGSQGSMIDPGDVRTSTLFIALAA